MYTFKLLLIFQTPSNLEADYKVIPDTAKYTCSISSPLQNTRLGNITYFLILCTILLMQVDNCIAVKSDKGLLSWSWQSPSASPHKNWLTSTQTRVAERWSHSSISMISNNTMHALNGNIRQLHVLHQNIPGMTKPDQASIHIDNIIDLYRPHVLFLGEVDANTVSLCCPENYIFIPGTLKNSNKIRISCLIHQNVKFKTAVIETEIPAVHLEIDTWHVVSVYREWSKAGDNTTNSVQDQFSRLENFCQEFKKIKGKKLLLGDVNINSLPSTTGHYQRLDPLKDLLSETMVSCGMIQLIHSPTRVQGQQSSILDHVYVSNSKFIEQIVNTSVCGTDHHLVGCKMRTDKPVFVPEEFTFRNIKAVTQEQFQEYWQSCGLHEIFRQPDPNLALDILEYKIIYVLNHLAPIKKVKTKEVYSPWITSELRDKIKVRNELRKTAEGNPTPENWSNFKKVRNSLKNELKQEKKKFYTDYLSAQDDATKWSRIKKLTGLEKAKKKEDMIINTGSETLTKPADVSSFMNEFFKNKVIKLQEKLSTDPEEALRITKDWFSKRKFKTTGFKTVSTSDVRRVILSLNNTGATGRDGISTKVLKKFAYQLSPAIRHVVNLCIMSSTFPDNWKLGQITPLPKAGDLGDPKNWRPIVINCAMSKILEVIINRQIVQHMETQQIFSSSQFAYRRRKGCGPALQDLDTQIQEHRNDGRTVALILTDMSAAFNVITKDVLIPKMAFYGFDESSCKLLTNYLTNRKTVTCISGCSSEPTTLGAGVGEGSVVGPTIFISGVCCVPSVAKKTMAICSENGIDTRTGSNEFADDCSGYVACWNEDDLQIGVNTMMANYKHYFASNGLALNETKCQVIVFRVKLPVRTIFLTNQPEVNCVRLLGLWMDSDGKYETHLGKVVHFCTYKISVLRKIRNLMSTQAFKKVAEALVLSKIRYCLELYSRPAFVQSKLQKTLNTLMRVCLNKDLRARVSDMLFELKWLNISNMYKFELCVNLRRILWYRTAPYSFYLLRYHAKHGYSTRYQDLGMVWLKNNQFGRNSFMMTAIRVYNELGLNPRWFNDFDEFKHDTRQEILHRNGNGNV